MGLWIRYCGSGKTYRENLHVCIQEQQKLAATCRGKEVAKFESNGSITQEINKHRKSWQPSTQLAFPWALDKCAKVLYDDSMCKDRCHNLMNKEIHIVRLLMQEWFQSHRISRNESSSFKCTSYCLHLNMIVHFLNTLQDAFAIRPSYIDNHLYPCTQLNSRT
jgi:hypothetical protein